MVVEGKRYIVHLVGVVLDLSSHLCAVVFIPMLLLLLCADAAGCPLLVL